MMRAVATGMVTLALVASATAGPLDDPNSGPQPGTTNVRPSLPSRVNELPPRFSPPAPRPGLQNRPAPGRQVGVPFPGTQRITVQYPGLPGVSRPWRGTADSSTGRRPISVRASDWLGFDPRTSDSVRFGWWNPNLHAIFRARGQYFPPAGGGPGGVYYFPRTGMVVARPLDLGEFIRFSGAGAYWSVRENSGASVVPPSIVLDNNGNVVVIDYPINWFDGPCYQWNSTRIVYDPQFAPHSAGYGVLPTPTGAGTGITVTQPAPAPVPPPTLLDEADKRFDAGDFAAAADLYRQHLVNAPTDAWVTRALAVSLLLSKQVHEGVDAMAKAYALQPNLAAEPLPLEAFPGGIGQVRSQIVYATAFAERTRSAEGWLTVAVLLQTSEQQRGALRVLEKAAGARLDPRIVDAFRATLNPPKP